MMHDRTSLTDPADPTAVADPIHRRHVIVAGGADQATVEVFDVAAAEHGDRRYVFVVDGVERFRLSLRHPIYAITVADEIAARVERGYLRLADPDWSPHQVTILLCAGARWMRATTTIGSG